MRRIVIATLFAFVLNVAAVAGLADGPKEESRLFLERIVPMLFEKCFCCHGGALREGGYSMADTEQMFNPGDSGLAPIFIGQPDTSELLNRMLAQDPTIRMPLDSEPLDPSAILDFRKWIASGAKVDNETKTKSLIELYGNTATSHRAPLHYPRPVAISSVLLSPDGSSLLVSGYSEVLIWNVEKESIEYRMPVRGRMISDLKWAPGGKLIVASGSPGSFGILEAFDYVSKAKLAAFGFSRDVCSGISASPYRNEVAAGFLDGSVTLFSLESYQPRVTSVAHAAAVTAIAWSSKNDRVYSASLDRSAKSFGTDDGQLRFAYSDHERSVGSIVDTQYGPVTLDETGALRVWSEGEEARTMAKQDGFAQIVQRIIVANEILLIADRDRIRRIIIEQDEVDDEKSKDKDKSGNEKPKKKKRTRFKELESLQSIPNRRILSIASSTNGVIAAGLDNGQVVLWRTGESKSPWKTWIAQPQ